MAAREIDPITHEPHCGASMPQHFAAMIQGFVVDGLLAGDCRDVYRALVEVAEFLRQIGGFQPYTASVEDSGDALVTPGATLAVAYIARQKAKFGSTIDGEVIDTPAIDTAEAQRAYDALTPEQKKRFN